jgi:hypothetical protein
MSAASKTQKEPNRAKTRKAVPEFQCHIKYKNELPLPPVSAVLFDASVALSSSDLFPSTGTGTGTFSTAYSAYEPTSFDHGIASHALPVDLLQMAMFNFVDLDRLNDCTGSRDADASQKDKDLLVPIEELERRMPGTVADAIRPEKSSTGASAASSRPQRSYVRPEVTWLRRTEYISASKSGNRGASGHSSAAPGTHAAAGEISRDEMQQLLSEPADWPQLVQAVEETFSAVKQPPMHPTNRNARLVQAFELLPEGTEDALAVFAHCFFTGDPGTGLADADPTAALLQSAPMGPEDASDAPSQTAPTMHCYIPETSRPSDPDAETTYHYAGDFEFQKQSSIAAGRNWVLMLPVGEEETRARVARIRGSWSLRKRRTAGNSRRPDLRASRLSPMEE